ncbi:hypothetical protein STANM309S_00560 [Streptomyces tanashiensis]
MTVSRRGTVRQFGVTSNWSMPTTGAAVAVGERPIPEASSAAARTADARRGRRARG